MNNTKMENNFDLEMRKEFENYLNRKNEQIRNKTKTHKDYFYSDLEWIKKIHAGTLKILKDK